jgi:two-component system, OmpR family, response regulator
MLDEEYPRPCFTGEGRARVSTAKAFPYWINEDVVVLRWPEQQAEAEHLGTLSVPRLLLVEPGAPPPASVSCLEDWVRMPADDGDVRARLEALVHRAREHPAVPSLDGHGQLSFRGRRVFLSPIDERIAAVLVAAFDRGVAEADLMREVWPHNGHPAKLRVHMSRLRKQITPIGLGIKAIRSFGYRLHGTSPADSTETRQATVALPPHT